MPLPWYLLLFLAMLAVVPAVHALRRRTSLVYSYAAIAFLTFAGWATPHAAAVALGGLNFGVASTVFFGPVLGGVFLLYVADGPRAGRMGVAVVVGIGLLYTGTSTLLRALARPERWPGPLLPLDSARAGAASVVASLTALVLLGIVWESMQRPPGRLPLFLRVLFTLSIVFVGDTVVYFPAAWAGSPGFLREMGGAAASRLIAAAVYAPILTAYLSFEVRRYGLTFTARPVLSIVAKEDLERELLSTRHNLRLGTEALWVSEEQYRRMVDDIPLLVFRFSRDGNVTYANRAVCTYYGRDVESLVGRSVLLTVEESERDSLLSKVLALTPRNPTVELIVHAHPTPEVRRTQRWVVRAIFSPENVAVAFQAIGEDVTEREEQARTLRRLRAAIDQASECVAIADARGRLEFVNPALERHSGRSGADLSGREALAIAASQANQEPYRRLADEVRRRGDWSGRVAFTAPSGAPRHYQLAITPLRDGSQELSGYLGIAAEVTREVELESALGQVRRMDAIAQLAGGVAHDFNNLLTVVWSSTQEAQEALAKQGAGAPAGAREALEDVRQAADRAALLTRQLMAISRTETGEPQAVDLSQKVEKLAPLLRRLLPKGVQLELECAVELPKVRVDPSEIDRAIVNLVVNARDAMPEGGRVTVSTVAVALDEAAIDGWPEARLGRHVVLAVRDTGPGISEAVRERLFEPFFTTKAASGGTGLGLSTVYGVIRQVGGHVRVESVPGDGATFLLYLPALVEPPDPAPPSARAVAHGGGTLLYCEADELVRSQLLQVLEGAGYRVLCAEDARALAEFVERPRSEPPVLLLADMVTWGMSGLELAAAVRRRWPSLPAVLLSGQARDHGARSVRGGARDWLVFKPYQYGDVLAAIEAAIGASGGGPGEGRP